MATSRLFVGSALLLLMLQAAPVTAAVVPVSSPNDLYFSSGPTHMKYLMYLGLVSDAGTAAQFDEGDIVRGVIQVTTTEQAAEVRVPDGSFELTGIFDARVRTVESTGPSSPHKFTLEPNPNFATELAALTGGSATDYAGAMLALFSDTAEEFGTTTASQAAVEATITNGDLFLVMGSDGTWGSDYYFAMQGPNDAVSPDAAIEYTGSLGLIRNETGGLVFADSVSQPPVPLFAGLGLESILNEFGVKATIEPNTDPGFATLYPLRADDPIVSLVPEPASALLLVIGFAGLLVGRLRGSAR